MSVDYIKSILSRGGKLRWGIDRELSKAVVEEEEEEFEMLLLQ